ncbi:MAG: MBL fold metallo-hydrolase [bacterium]|nr:MBL fold metallo-hydrolase [bacterium]
MQKIVQIELDGVNSYLIKNGDAFLLVDTGGHMFMDKVYTNRRDALEKRLEEEGVNENNLRLIVLTHGDNDHVCNAKYLRDKYHARIAMHPSDVWMVKRADFSCYQANSNYESPVLKLFFHFMNSKIDLLMKKVYAEFEPFRPDILLKEGQSLKDYNFDGTIYHCPGHTNGSIGILDSKGNFICGDLFANNKKPALAINAKNFKELRMAAKQVLGLKVTTIYPGHGKPFQAAAIKVNDK